MADDLDRAAAQLADRSGTWVARRDAADFLGKVAARARAVLGEFAEDSDTDVRAAVQQALGDASWRDAGREGKEAQLTLDELVRTVERPGKREIRPTGSGFEITVTLKDGRQQKVQVSQAASAAGAEIYRVRSRCGAAADKALEWALRTNDRLPHCSFAIVEEGGQKWFELVHSLRSSKATAQEFKASVKEVAFYADWAEAQLSKEDMH